MASHPFPLLRRLALLSLTLLAACSPPSGRETQPPPAAPLQTALPTQSASPGPAAPTFTPSPVFTATPTEIPSLQICSPLADILLSEIGAIISNPYDPPRPGLDDGHHGVDFAFYRYGDKVGMLGWPVQSVTTGIVSSVLPDRPPYGNGIIIETPLTTLTGQQIQELRLPAVVPTLRPPVLTCPEDSNALPISDDGQRSLYILYAHLNEPSIANVGDTVACGQVIGGVGTTGWSVNEHLHLEIRIGPSAARFDSMAHGITSATDEEMTAYCAWRVSQAFQLIDPLQVLDLTP